MSYFDWDSTEASCPKCLWRGMGALTTSDFVGSTIIERYCPSCSERLAFFAVPTIEDAKRNIDKLPPGEQAWVEGYEQRRREHAAAILVSPKQLPDVVGDSLVLSFAIEGGSDEEAVVVIRDGVRELWREPARYECYERFCELLKVLKRKYRHRLKDLVPKDGCEMYLYGDSLFSGREQVDAARSTLKRG